MGSTPSGPQANTNRGSSAEMKALEEALSSIVGEAPSDWRPKMASSDALRAVEPSPYPTPRPADLNPHSPDNVLSFGVICAIQI